MSKPRSYPTPRVATNDARDASPSPVVHTHWNPVEFSAADMAEARAGYDALLQRRRVAAMKKQQDAAAFNPTTWCGVMYFDELVTAPRTVTYTYSVRPRVDWAATLRAMLDNGTPTPRVWNAACDHEIDAICAGVISRARIYSGATAEEVYRLLREIEAPAPALLPASPLDHTISANRGRRSKP